MLVFSWLSNHSSSGKQFDPHVILKHAGDSNKVIHLAETLQETPVLLYFWATWCPTCKESMPALGRLAEDDWSNKLVVYAVNYNETEAQVIEYLEGHDINYPVLMDEKGDLAARLKVSGLPSVVLLAKGGKILYYGFSLPETEALQGYLEG